MNLDDLRAELDAHARDIDPYATGRMSGIRAKIAQRRRRKAGATVAASVLAVGAIIGVPVASHLSAGPEPAEGGGPFPEKIDGDTKIAQVTGDEGDTTVTLKFTPDDTDFLLKIDCENLPERQSSGGDNGRWWNVAYEVNGERGPSLCGPDGTGSYVGDVGGAATPGQVRTHWESFGVRPGEPVEIELRIVSDTSNESGSTRIEGAQIGAAVYDMTGERVKTDGVGFPKEKHVDGETYELAGYDVGMIDSTSARIKVPALEDPALVTYGATDSARRGKQSVALDGRDGVLQYGGGVSAGFLPDADAHKLRVVDGDARGTPDIVAAYYTRVDDENESEADVFPEQVDGDTKIAGKLGDEGDTKMTLTFTPEDTDFLLDIECDALTPVDSTVEGRLNAPVLRMRVNGRWISPSCGRDFDSDVHPGFVGGVASRDQMREFWEEGGIVEPGKPVTVTLQVAPELYGKPRSKPIDGRIGVAVYEMTGERRNVLGAALPTEKTVDGETYALASDGYSVGPAKPYESLDLFVPETHEPTFVSYGSIGRHVTTSRGSIDGARGRLPRTDGVASATMPEGGSYTAKVQNLSDVRTKLVLAYYTPSDGDAEDDEEDELAYPMTSTLGDLVASDVGDAGEVSTTQTITTDTLDLNLTATCQVPGMSSEDSNSELRMRIKVDGRKVWEAWCGPQRHIINGSYYSPERSDETLVEAWKRLGLTTNEAHEVRLTLVGPRAKKSLPSDTRIGFALYGAPGEQVLQNGAHLRTVERVGGESYSLAGRETMRVAQSRSLRKEIPAGHDDVLVVYGQEGGPIADNAWVSLLDGERFGSTVNPTESSSSKRLRDEANHSVELRARKHVRGGVLYIAYYLPEE